MKEKFVTAQLDDVLRYYADGYVFKDEERMPRGSGLHEPEIYVDQQKRVVIFKFYVRDVVERACGKAIGHNTCRRNIGHPGDCSAA